MRITIEDLEALKELSDELEENHMETEKQLHEDLGVFVKSNVFNYSNFLKLETKETQVRERLRKIEALEETRADYKSMINQFRDLV